MDPQVVAAIIGALVAAVTGALAGGAVAALQARRSEHRAASRETWAKRIHETRQNLWVHATYRRNAALGWSPDRLAALVRVVPGHATFPHSDFALVGDVEALTEYAAALAELEARPSNAGSFSELEQLRLETALHAVRIGLDRNEDRVNVGMEPVRVDWAAVKRSIDPHSVLFPLD